MVSEGVVVLAGGVGASKLLVGLSQVIPPELITIVGNTGDDFKVCGLRICPDLDTVTYTLAGKVDPSRGWGVSGDDFDCLEWLQAYGAPSWFRLGDRDLATHLWRTHLLGQGVGLAEVTARIGRTWGLRSLLLPMTESYTPTRVLTDQGDLHLQEYLVREKCRPRVLQVSYRHVEQSRLPPGLPEKVAGACRVVIAPSNPLISIGPILAVPGMRDLLREFRSAGHRGQSAGGGQGTEGTGGQNAKASWVIRLRRWALPACCRGLPISSCSTVRTRP